MRNIRFCANLLMVTSLFLIIGCRSSKESTSKATVEKESLSEIKEIQEADLPTSTHADESVDKTTNYDGAVTGNWLLTSDFNGRPVNSLLMLSKDKDGNYQGSWGSFRGIDPIDDLKIKDGNISFTQTNRFRDQEFTMTFAGTVKDGELTGAMVSNRGENTFKGSRIKPLPAIVGVWEFRRQRQDREFISTLIVSQDKDGQFNADWQSQRSNSWEISDVKYEDEKLTFTRKNTDPDRQRETTYTLTAQDDTISGTMMSPGGEREIEGKRLHSDLIGKWELTITSDRGQRKQLLWIRPDMTALYGSADVGTVSVEDGNISFRYEISFGDRSFENEFTGQLQAGTLTGEMSNSRGSQQVTGQKMPQEE